MSELADRVERRIREEWPGTLIIKEGLFQVPEITPGGVTDRLVQLVAMIVKEEAAEVEELAWQYKDLFKAANP